MIQDIDVPEAPGATLQCLEPQWTTFAGPLLREKFLQQYKVYHYSISTSFQLGSSVTSPQAKIWIFYEENCLYKNVLSTWKLHLQSSNAWQTRRRCVKGCFRPEATHLIQWWLSYGELELFRHFSFDILQKQPNAACLGCCKGFGLGQLTTSIRVYLSRI